MRLLEKLFKTSREVNPLEFIAKAKCLTEDRYSKAREAEAVYIKSLPRQARFFYRTAIASLKAEPIGSIYCIAPDSGQLMPRLNVDDDAYMDAILDVYLEELKGFPDLTLQSRQYNRLLVKLSNQKEIKQ